MTLPAHTREARPLPPRRREAGAEREADRVARFGAPARAPSGRLPRGAGGRPLAPEVRAWAEPELGLDLAAVRVHDDAETHAAAAGRHARALAAGGDLLFARGAYRPGTPAGRELLLHELAHVAQQAGGDAVTQHQDDAPRTGGPGRTPPEAEYTVAEGPAAAPEDVAALFGHDGTEVEKGLRGRVTQLLATRGGPVVVRVHGYSSREGDRRYNLNLSAHRAVAVRAAIADLLPAGSRLELVAHGETGAFGREPGGNRRAGVAVADLPAQGGTMLDAERVLRRHPDVLGGRLKLEPPRKLKLTVDWDPGDPRRVVRQPSAIDLTPAPLPFVMGHIPWGDLNADFRLRGLTLGTGEQAVILRHWATWYPLARALEGRNPLRFGPKSADDWMTTMTRKMLSNSLSGERPDAVEAFDQDLKRKGFETPIYFPPLELSF